MIARLSEANLRPLSTNDAVQRTAEFSGTTKRSSRDTVDELNSSRAIMDVAMGENLQEDMSVSSEKGPKRQPTQEKAQKPQGREKPKEYRSGGPQQGTQKQS